jgi:hypothetical protein
MLVPCNDRHVPFFIPYFHQKSNLNDCNFFTEVGHVTYQSNRHFVEMKGVKNAKISLQSLKKEFRLHNQFDHLIHRKFYMEQEKIYFRGSNKPSEPKNGIWAKNSINISHDTTDFEAQIPFLGFDNLFSPF